MLVEAEGASLDPLKQLADLADGARATSTTCERWPNASPHRAIIQPPSRHQPIMMLICATTITSLLGIHLRCPQVPELPEVMPEIINRSTSRQASDVEFGKFSFNRSAGRSPIRRS